MAKRRGMAKRGAKRPARARRQARRRTHKLTRTVGAFYPDRMVTTLTYASAITLAFTDPSPGNIDYLSWFANSIYSVWQGSNLTLSSGVLTALTYQPYGTDTLETLYNTFSVLSSKAYVEVMPENLATSTYNSITGNGTSTGAPSLICSLALNDTYDTTVFPGGNLLMRPGAVTGMCNTTRSAKLKKSFNCKGIGDVSLNRGQMGSSDPLDKRFYQLTLQYPPGGNVIPSAVYLIKTMIKFKVLLSDRKLLPVSS